MTAGHLPLLIRAVEDPLGVAQHRQNPGEERHPRPPTGGEVSCPYLGPVPELKAIYAFSLVILAMS